jgi:hypothetical protein
MECQWEMIDKQSPEKVTIQKFEEIFINGVLIPPSTDWVSPPARVCVGSHSNCFFRHSSGVRYVRQSFLSPNGSFVELISCPTRQT